MFPRIFIGCCLLVMVFSAPVDNSTSMPNIDLPDSDGEKSKFEQLGGGFQGDMIFPEGFDPTSPKKGKGVAAYGPRQWPNRIIPYDLSAISSSAHRTMIQDAMHILMYAVGTPFLGTSIRRACVFFRPRISTDRTYFRAVYGGGCSATVGYWPNYVSTLTLNNPGCFYYGTIQHELMHILGFYHEQSRPDRDWYVTVNYGNIITTQWHNFQKLQWDVTAQSLSTPYDYGSLMHYGAYGFSKNGLSTIVPKSTGVSIGQRVALSATDILEIRRRYGC